MPACRNDQASATPIVALTARFQHSPLWLRPADVPVEFSRHTRRKALEIAAESVLDILVVGGGITGAGVLREAALKGYSVALVDRSDFAAGTSSRSSKLIHGGVRYLQQGDLKLVREAARERARLHRMAPHLAVPVSMMVPAASKGGVLKVAAGLWTFDRLAGDPSDRHKVLSRKDTRAAEPCLRKNDRLAGSVVFTEYVTNDARLTLETIKSGVAEGGLAASYAEVTAIEFDTAGLRASIRDVIGGEDLVVRCRCLVNAGGPWMEQVRALGTESAGGLLQLTRGIHLVVARERLPVKHSVVLRAPDGRSTFIVPAGRYSYIGTTDTHFEGDRAEPGVSIDDADYLLESVASTIENPPDASDIIGTWSGVRPLLAQEGKAPSEISRRDEILDGPGPMVSVAGGKLTTYRRMAERVVERAATFVGRPPAQDVDSSERALSGGNLRDQRQARYDAPELDDPELADRLWATYGCEAAGIVARIKDDPSAAEPVGGAEELTRAEVDHCVRHEMTLTLDDLLRRRTRVGMFDGFRAAAAAVPAAARMAEHLGWDAARRDIEAEKFKMFVEHLLSVVRATV